MISGSIQSVAGNHKTNTEQEKVACWDSTATSQWNYIAAIHIVFRKQNLKNYGIAALQDFFRNNMKSLPLSSKNSEMLSPARQPFALLAIKAKAQ